MTMFRRTFPARVMLFTVALASAGLGCAFGEIYWGDPLKRQYSLEIAQQRYTQLVRWSEFKKAAAFVDPAQRDRYIQEAPSLRQLRFTEFESGPVDIDEESGTATVDVTYYAYQPSSPIEVPIREKQEWFRTNISNNWRVRPSFEGLEDLALNQAAR